METELAGLNPVTSGLHHNITFVKKQARSFYPSDISNLAPPDLLAPKECSESTQRIGLYSLEFEDMTIVALTFSSITRIRFLSPNTSYPPRRHAGASSAGRNFISAAHFSRDADAEAGEEDHPDAPRSGIS